MFATGLALLANAFHGRDRGVAFGVFGAITGVAVAVGPVLGGALTSGLSWRWIFFVNIPVGIVALVVTLRAVERVARPARAPRSTSSASCTFSLGLAALVYGLIRSSEDGWGSTTVVGSLIAAAVLLVAFVVAEALQSEPMFDLTLFRKPTFVGGLIAAFAISASLFALLPYLVLYMQNVLGYSAIEIGVRFLVLSGPIFFTAAIAGRLTEKVPTALPDRARLRCCVGVALLLMRGLDAGRRLDAPDPGLHRRRHRRGPRSTCRWPRPRSASSSRRGRAWRRGINSTFRQVGIATGVAALGAIFSHHVGDAAAGRPSGFVDGLNAILLVGASLALVAARDLAGPDPEQGLRAPSGAPRLTQRAARDRLAAACCRCGTCCASWSWRSPPGRPGSTARCAGCTSPSSRTRRRGCPAASCCSRPGCSSATTRSSATTSRGSSRTG